MTSRAERDQLRARCAQNPDALARIESEFAAEDAAQVRRAAFRRNTVLGVVGGVVLLFGGCSAISRGTTIEAGNAGVRVNSLVNVGINPEPVIGPRWVYRGFGEKIVEYPTIERRYSYTRESNDDGHENEELTFVDRNGLPITGDVNIGLRVQPRAAPGVWLKYRASLDQLLENQIRNDVRTAVARAAATMPVEQMLGGGHQRIIASAFDEVRRNWAKDGIDIVRLEWSGALRFPNSVTASIQARAQADQQVHAAAARVAVSEANARVKVADAQGDADAMRIRGEALRANPQTLEQLAIEKWNGNLPQVMGAGATPFVNLK